MIFSFTDREDDRAVGKSGRLVGAAREVGVAGWDALNGCDLVDWWVEFCYGWLGSSRSWMGRAGVELGGKKKERQRMKDVRSRRRRHR